MRSRRIQVAVVLLCLQAAFVARVTGQLAVAAGIAPWLPAFENWQSGLLPYPALVIAQFAIIAAQSLIAYEIVADKGFFAQRNSRVGSVLTKCGVIYFVAMIARFFITQGALPIPVFFHLLLATYILVLAGHLKTAPNVIRQI